MFSGCITVEVGVPRLGNCLEMYTCAQFVHSMSTNLDTPCTLELLPGHSCVCVCACVCVCVCVCGVVCVCVLCVYVRVCV